MVCCSLEKERQEGGEGEKEGEREREGRKAWDRECQLLVEAGPFLQKILLTFLTFLFFHPSQIVTSKPNTISPSSGSFAVPVILTSISPAALPQLSMLHMTFHSMMTCFGSTLADHVVCCAICHTCQ